MPIAVALIFIATALRIDIDNAIGEDLLLDPVGDLRKRKNKTKLES